MVVMRAIPLFEGGTVLLGMTPMGTKRIEIHKPLRDNGDERSTINSSYGSDITAVKGTSTVLA